MDCVHHPCGLEKQQGWQSITKHVQMSVNDIWVMLPQNAMQPVVRPAIEPPSLSQVFHTNAEIIQKAFQFAANPPPNRDDRHVKLLTIQPSNNVYRDALRTTRTEHGNDMRYFSFLHEFGSSAGVKFL